MTSEGREEHLIKGNLSDRQAYQTPSGFHHRYNPVGVASASMWFADFFLKMFIIGRNEKSSSSSVGVSLI